MTDDADADGCALDFEKDADDDETASLRPLFPEGHDSEHTAEDWHDLFSADA